MNAGYQPTGSVVPWTATDGVLRITADKTSEHLKPLIQNNSYTSGMINSYHQFSQTYGYFEMRAQLPEGKGLWPAFWLLRQDGLVSSEIDILEMIGQESTKLHNAVHSWETGQISTKGNETAVPDMTKGFHTYGLSWQPDKIAWYFDGQKVFETDTPADMHTPMFMIANLAVGGTWPGDPDAGTAFPSSMLIDHIRVYSDKSLQPYDPPRPQPPGNVPGEPPKESQRGSGAQAENHVMAAGGFTLFFPGKQGVGILEGAAACHAGTATMMTEAATGPDLVPLPYFPDPACC